MTPVAWPLLSLDVSSSAAGWAVFRHGVASPDFGIVAPKSTALSLARIDIIVASLVRVALAHDVASVVMEWTAGKTHRRVGRATGLGVLGQAQGSVRQVLLDRGLPVKCVSENEWTACVSKAGRARSVRIMFPEYASRYSGGGDAGLDAADALGLGWWYLAEIKQLAALESLIGPSLTTRLPRPVTQPRRKAP